MKNYVSYVIQNSKGHTFHSEIVETKNPQYSYSRDPQISDVLKWTDEKQSTLMESQKLVVLNIYKV